MSKAMRMRLRMSCSMSMSDEGETRRWLCVSLQSVVVCMCVRELVLQVIAQDAVLLWPDDPESVIRSTGGKKTDPAAQHDLYIMCCCACSTSYMNTVKRMPRENLTRRAGSNPAHARP